MKLFQELLIPSSSWESSHNWGAPLSFSSTSSPVFAKDDKFLLRLVVVFDHFLWSCIRSCWDLDSKNSSSAFHSISEKQELADWGRAEVAGISKAQRKLVEDYGRREGV